jgi:type VI secretion system secreted protein VgrG
MTSPLGADVLVPTAISGYEAISQPFSYRVQLVSNQSDIDPDQLLHQPGCVILRRGDDVARYFHGIFQEFAAAGQPRDGMYAYHAVLVPQFWFLSQTIDCRVFQDKRATEILRQMLDDAGVDHTDFRIYKQPPLRHYRVQFNETDLQFATRLMEESGLFYFFEHAEDKHTLVVADSNDAFHDLDGAALRFDANVAGEDVLRAWNRPRGTTHGKVTLKDYDPKDPGKKLEASQDSTQPVKGAKQRDVFLWPAATHDDGIVETRSKLMIEAAEASVSVSSGAGAFRSLAAGGKFSLEHDPVTGDDGASHVVRWMSFEAADESWTTEGAPAFYANSFDCFPAAVTWRQPFSVARPDMGSIHAAIVLGPDGEEIYTDEWGRVKVQFFWDYRKEASADKAVWARVVQPWAGGGWGAQFIPRVGTEVAVAFIDGDADRPVVLGGLYNGKQKPIYPDSEKTKSGLRTRSSQQGGSDEFNELTFDDNKGQEMVFMQAQKDMSVKVKHDQTATIGHDRSVSVDHDQSVSIGSNQSLSVGQDRTVKISNSESITIGQDRTTQIDQGDDSLTVSMGNLNIDVSMGKAVVTAMQSIELRVGNSSIVIDQSGVTINGMVISVNGDASVSVGAPMTSVSGDATVTIQGGLVEIN